MKKIFMKALSISLVIIMTFCMVPVSGFASTEASEFEIANNNDVISNCTLDELNITPEIIDISAYHGSTDMFDKRNGNGLETNRNSSTYPNAVMSPILSNGSYDFYELTSDWSSSDGSIRWNDRSQILTLSNAYISSGATSCDNFGIYVPHNSTIVLVGQNTVISGNSGSGGYDSIGVICNGNLKFEGSGSLVAKAGDASKNSYGILARYDVIVNDCQKIEAIGGYGTQFSAGFSSESGNVTFTNTKFIGRGGKSNSGCSVGIDTVSTFTANQSTIEGYADTSALNWGIYFGKVSKVENCDIIGRGGDIPSNAGSASIYCSYGIYIDETARFDSTKINAASGKVRKSGNGGASYGLACNDDLALYWCSVDAVGDEAVNNSYGILIKGNGELVYNQIIAESYLSKKSLGLSANNLMVFGGIYNAASVAETTASALFANNSLALYEGEINARGQCNNDAIGVCAGSTYVHGGRIVASATENIGHSCGLYGNVSLICGDIICTGDDNAYEGNEIKISENCLVSGSEEFEDTDLAEGVISSGKIIVPSANNAVAKTARIYYNMNGKMLYAYASSNNLPYKETTNVFAHCENPAVYYKYESSDSSVIKVSNSISGLVTALNDGTATITVTAYDIFTDEVIRDEKGNIASAKVEITCKMSFWEKIVRFFRRLFGME